MLFSCLSDELRGNNLAHVKLNLGMSWHKKQRTKKDCLRQKIGCNLRKELEESYNWRVALYGDETWTLREADE